MSTNSAALELDKVLAFGPQQKALPLAEALFDALLSSDLMFGAL